MTREEAEPIIIDLLRNLNANPQFAAPRKTFEAMDVFCGPDPAANGSGPVAAETIPS